MYNKDYIHVQYCFIHTAGKDDPCYRCSNFNSMGQGFIEADDNPPYCTHYRECWKTEGSDEIKSVDRWCPPGTSTDPYDILRGAPCTSLECNNTICMDCEIPTVSTPAQGE